ncbi:hypothetical protein [Kibdelosporangium persicum]|nr:hypothetical protein [Kibdelosporangium persicum]
MERLLTEFTGQNLAFAWMVHDPHPLRTDAALRATTPVVLP